MSNLGRLWLAATIALISLAMGASQPAIGQEVSQSKIDQTTDQLKVCLGHSSDRRFDSLRGVFPLDGDATDAMLALRATPSATQSLALREYKTIVVECMRAVFDRQSMADKSGSLFQRADDLTLDLLIRRQMTFADYALLKRAEQARVTYWTGELRKAFAARDADAKAATANAQATLVCTFDEEKNRGLELSVKFDERTNQVAPSSVGQVTRSWITQSDIGYQQGQFTTAISRLTGRLRVTGEGSTVIAAGQCKAAPAKLF